MPLITYVADLQPPYKVKWQKMKKRCVKIRLQLENLKNRFVDKIDNRLNFHIW